MSSPEFDYKSTWQLCEIGDQLKVIASAPSAKEGRRRVAEMATGVVLLFRNARRVRDPREDF